MLVKITFGYWNICGLVEGICLLSTFLFSIK